MDGACWSLLPKHRLSESDFHCTAKNNAHENVPERPYDTEKGRKYQVKEVLFTVFSSKARSLRRLWIILCRRASV